MIEPSPEMINRTVSLGYVVRVVGGYDYSDSFKASAKEYISRKHGFLETARLQRLVASFAMPVFIAYPDSVKKRDLLMTIALFVIWHSGKTGYDFKKDKDSANLLYTLLYLDQLIPDVKI